MKPDQLADERQADAASLVGARLKARDSMEALEQLRYLFLRNADARIAHLENGVVLVRAQANRDASLERVLERVRKKVQNDLLPHVAVDRDRRAQVGAVEVELEPGTLDRRPK